ncbi:membrane frizzled-related protein isoform X2 [Patella vulgata]|nr:membrane frizzled-related protein isoform X2 [Patella vulgata]
MKPPLPVAILICIMGVSIQIVHCSGCDHKFSSKDMKTGTFSSPNFPENYAEMTTCHYFFESVGDGRIEVEFDYFELEEKGEGDSICRFDYIDVFSVDRMGYRTRLNRFCGKEIPPTIISVQPSLEIVFVSDYTKISSGFSAHFTFLDDSWRPFRPSTAGCGDEVLDSGGGGVITSPDYPSPFRRGSECTWLIKVREGQQIVVNIIALDLGVTSETCKDFKLLIYNGFATPDMLPEISLCGDLKSYSPSKRHFLSHSSRVVIRFVTSETDVDHGIGFKLSWAAVLMPEDGPCGQFICAGGQMCIDDILCEPSPKYCIHKSLRCDGVPNCGPFDDSDERKCPREIIIMTASIAIPSLCVILLVVLVIYCYRRKRVKKSTSQEQPLTTSQRQISRDSMAPRGGQLVMHTSFIDTKPMDESEPEIDPDSLPLPYPPPDLDQTPCIPPSPTMPPSPPIPPPPPPCIPVDNGFMPKEPKTKSSLKRDSYTFSPPKQLTYEEGNMIIAEI